MSIVRGRKNERQHGKTGIVTRVLPLADKEKEDENISLHINTDVSSHLE
jgi:hypothetical protein